jgi:retron-type reverse transcriptase
MSSHFADQKALYAHLFSADEMLSAFEQRFKQSKTRGVDRLTGADFADMLDELLPKMLAQMESGRYRFSPYSEVLSTKGRDKAPRMISVATIRDRLVLRQVNRFLQGVYRGKLDVLMANQTVAQVIAFLNNCDKSTLWVYKGDVQRFYDEIPHDQLLVKLKKRVSQAPILSAIEHALITPTVPKNMRKKDYHLCKPQSGVPQGLAISNILANIYLSDVDVKLKETHPDVAYFRFVDDILILGSKEKVMAAEAKLEKLMTEAGLRLHGDQTKRFFKPFAEGFGFLGYVFTEDKLSVRPSTLNRLHLRLIGLVTEFNHRFKSEQPSEKDLKRLVNRLNYKITGLINGDNNSFLGWLAYFRNMTDLPLLFELDAFVARLLKRVKGMRDVHRKEIKSYVRTYFVARHQDLAKQTYIPVLMLEDLRKQKDTFEVEEDLDLIDDLEEGWQYFES